MFTAPEGKYSGIRQVFTETVSGTCMYTVMCTRTREKKLNFMEIVFSLSVGNVCMF